MQRNDAVKQFSKIFFRDLMSQNVQILEFKCGNKLATLHCFTICHNYKKASIFSSQGCPVVAFQSERLKHQTVCDFRPLHCQYSSHGCSMVLSVKVRGSGRFNCYHFNISQDLAWHHKQCTFATLKNDFELEPEESEVSLNPAPSMPTRKKASMKVKSK